MKVSRRNFLKLTGLSLLPYLFPLKLSAATSGIPVLLYHDISSECSDLYSIDPRLFAAQMEWLYGNGYRAVSLRDIGDKGKIIPGKTVVITFDDGYASFMDYAFPLLGEYGFKATVNIIGVHVGKYIKQCGSPPMLSWDEYRHLKRSGLVDLGCHTFDLHRMGGILGVSADVLEKDLRLFQEEMKMEIGAPADILAWPYGIYDRKSISVARGAGFRYLLTSHEGYFRSGGDLGEIPRLNMNNRLDLVSFRQYIGGVV